jgi:hypothetical protein
MHATRIAIKPGRKPRSKSAAGAAFDEMRGRQKSTVTRYREAGKDREAAYLEHVFHMPKKHDDK